MTDLSQMTSRELLSHFAPRFSKVKRAKTWITLQSDRRGESDFSALRFTLCHEDGTPLNPTRYFDPYINIQEAGISLNLHLDADKDIHEVILKNLCTEADKLLDATDLHLVLVDKKSFKANLEVRGTPFNGFYFDKEMSFSWGDFVPFKSSEGRLISARRALESSQVEEKRIREELHKSDQVQARFEEALEAVA